MTQPCYIPLKSAEKIRGRKTIHRLKRVYSTVSLGMQEIVDYVPILAITTLFVKDSFRKTPSFFPKSALKIKKRLIVAKNLIFA